MTDDDSRGTVEEEEDEGVFVLDLDDDGDPEEAAREAVEAIDEARRLVDDVDEDETTIAQLEEELAELRDRSVRTLADFDNYRKRAERQREELRKYALSDFLREFLPIVDNLHRALESPGSVEDLKVGVELIERQIGDLLRQRGVTRIEALGEPFDPSLHEAVNRVEDPDVEVPRVQEVMQTGYRIHERLLRPALVTVAMPAEDDGARETEIESETERTEPREDRER